MEDVKTAPRQIVSPLFLFIFATITTVAIFIFVYHATTTFRTTDVTVQLSPLTPQKREEFGGNPVVVDVGLSIRDFRKFDIIHDDFVFEGTLTFSFDPALTSLQTIEQITIAQGEILYRSAPSTYIWQGKMYAHYDIRAKFSNNINFELFPLDDHSLNIIFIQKYVSPTELIFDSKNSAFVIGQDMAFIGWHKINQGVEVGYIEESLDQIDKTDKLYYPAVIFTADYGRQSSVRNTFIIVLPMLLLFFVALFSVIIDPKENFSLNISIAIQSIVGILAFRFVLESMSPQVGYFMYSDYIFFMFLIMSFAILLFNALGYNFGSHIRKVFIVLINAVVIMCFGYFLWI